MTERTQGETEGVEQVPTEAGDQDPASRAPEPGGPMTQRMRDDPTKRTNDEGEDEVDPGVLPQDAPRGGTTVPTPNDTGGTTPPIGGWGEAPVAGDDDPGD
jgi:hypothetical protein